MNIDNIKVSDLNYLINKKNTQYQKLLLKYHNKEFENFSDFQKNRYDLKLDILKNILNISRDDLKTETKIKNKIAGKVVHYDKNNIYDIVFYNYERSGDYRGYYNKYYKFKLDVLSYIFGKKNKIVYVYYEDTGVIQEIKEEYEPIDKTIFTEVEQFLSDLLSFDGEMKEERELSNLISKYKGNLLEKRKLEDDLDILLKSDKIITLQEKIYEFEKALEEDKLLINEKSEQISYTIINNNFSLQKNKITKYDYEKAEEIANNQKIEVPYRIKKEINKKDLKEKIKNNLCVFKDCLSKELTTNLKIR